MNSGMPEGQLTVKLASHPWRLDLQTTRKHCKWNRKMTPKHCKLIWKKYFFCFPLSKGWKKDPYFSKHSYN